ncbi:MAG: AtpZ/AtpI family protein [Bradymonadales bacterium]|nr:AtpZ/AtpI family protein [Bradymonadales bacterium]
MTAPTSKDPSVPPVDPEPPQEAPLGQSGDFDLSQSPTQQGVPLPEPTNDDLPQAATSDAEDNQDGGLISREYRRVMYQFSFIGIEFGVALALGALLGRWLDRKLDTAPWFLLACVLFGLAVASRDLYRACRKAYPNTKGKGTPS